MNVFIKKHISKTFFFYLVVLFLLSILPINGKESALNNNYILTIRLDYLGHFGIMCILSFLGIILAKIKQQNIWLISLFIFFFAASSEFLQMIIPWRAYNINDLVANFVGVILGILGVFILLLVNKKYKLACCSNFQSSKPELQQRRNGRS